MASGSRPAALTAVLLTKCWGMHKRPKGNKKYRNTPKGLRLRKTVRGKIITDKTMQVNIKTLKSGHKSLAEIFPEQNKKEIPQQETPAQETAA